MLFVRLPRQLTSVRAKSVVQNRCSPSGKTPLQHPKGSINRVHTSTSAPNIKPIASFTQNTPLQGDCSLQEQHWSKNDKSSFNQHATMDDWEKSFAEPVSGDNTQRDKIRYNKKQPKYLEKINQSFSFLYNYVEACIQADLITEATCIIEKCLEDFAPSINEKTIELYFRGIVDLSENTQHKPVLEIQNVMQKIMHSKVKLTSISYGCMIAALHKFKEDNQSLRVIYNDFKSQFPIDICMSYFKGDEKIFNLLKEIRHIYEDNEDRLGRIDLLSKNDCTASVTNRLFGETKQSNAAMPQILTEKTLEHAFQEQITQDLLGSVKVPNILAPISGVTAGEQGKQETIEKLKKSWFPTLIKAFRAKKDEEEVLWLSNRRGTYPFLCILPDDVYVHVIIDHLLTIPKSGERTSMTIRKLGQAVYTKYFVQNLLETETDVRLHKLYSEYINIYLKDTSKSPRVLWNELEDKMGKWKARPSILPWHGLWCFMIGIRLLEILISSTTFSIGRINSVPSAFISSIPVVYNTYTIWGKRMCGITIPHPLFVQLVNETSQSFRFETSILPMVAPPIPWISTLQGGCLLSPNDFVRTEELDRTDPSSTHLDAYQISPVFDALNVISSVAWKINKNILDLQLKVFLAKGDESLEIPPPAEECPSPPSLAGIKDLSPDERKVKFQEIYYAKKKSAEMHSLHCDALYKLSIANYYRDKIIWFPHNLDFRGRVYPISKHLNYMGADSNRALFRFADGRELGDRGLEWLKIHLINLTGFKKHESNQVRLQYADEMLEEIFDSADNPLTGRGWWKTSDEPWQTLATCIELTNALRSSEPTKFISYLPIHQDGSCNGLQHYAALGRDSIGSKQVNLSPSAAPQDVYATVAKDVERKRVKDAKNGLQIAKDLEGLINRKLVKQTVMTTVYGVTRYGASQQIRKQIEDIPVQTQLTASLYLVNVLFDSLSSMFTSATCIQRWLTALSDCLTNGNHSMEWITPLGIHVKQPYYVNDSYRLVSSVQKVNYAEPTRTPNVMKQRNAFAPNFVHSLDSTHMMLTALHCYSAGVKFSSVHDCYWTHACNIDRMNVICREQFVSLHSQPILQRLAEHLSNFLPPKGHDVIDDKRYIAPSQRGNLVKLLDSIPKHGDFDIKEVNKSVYFFS